MSIEPIKPRIIDNPPIPRFEELTAVERKINELISDNNDLRERLNKLEKETIKSIGNTDTPLCKLCLQPEHTHLKIEPSTYQPHNFVV